MRSLPMAESLRSVISPQTEEGSFNKVSGNHVLRTPDASLQIKTRNLYDGQRGFIRERWLARRVKPFPFL
jgi:hypothetical protein